MSIDWFAVQVCLEGTRMRLTPDERVAVVRRLAHRLRPNTMPNDEAAARGLVTSEEIGRRIGCSDRQVERMKAALPKADKLKCEVCRTDMWVRQDGFIEPHADSFYKQCPLSGLVYQADWEAELANTAVWLSQRLKSGDSTGVWEYLERLNVADSRRLLVAALAAASEDDDPFAWLKEAV